MSFDGPSDPNTPGTPPPGSPPPPPGGAPPPPPPPPPPGGTPPPAASFGAPPPPPAAPGGFGAPAQAGAYGAPAGGYAAPPAASQTNGLAIGSLVCGILTIVSCGGAGVLGLAAIILGFLGLGKAKEQNGNGKGMAIGGMVTGVLGLLIGVVLLITVVLAADSVDNEINSDPSDGICNSDRFLQDPDC